MQHLILNYLAASMPKKSQRVVLTIAQVFKHKLPLIKMAVEMSQLSPKNLMMTLYNQDVVATELYPFFI